MDKEKLFYQAYLRLYTLYGPYHERYKSQGTDYWMAAAWSCYHERHSDTMSKDSYWTRIENGVINFLSENKDGSIPTHS